MKRFWCRFYTSDIGSWEYSGPWWISGEYGVDNVLIVCCAIIAPNYRAAEELILKHFDSGAPEPQISFINGRSSDWEPFCDRFPRLPWMRWPEPAEDLLKLRGTPEGVGR